MLVSPLDTAVNVSLTLKSHPAPSGGNVVALTTLLHHVPYKAAVTMIIIIPCALDVLDRMS